MLANYRVVLQRSRWKRSHGGTGISPDKLSDTTVRCGWPSQDTLWLTQYNLNPNLVQLRAIILIYIYSSYFYISLVMVLGAFSVLIISPPFPFPSPLTHIQTSPSCLPPLNPNLPSSIIFFVLVSEDCFGSLSFAWVQSIGAWWFGALQGHICQPRPTQWWRGSEYLA